MLSRFAGWVVAGLAFSATVSAQIPNGDAATAAPAPATEQPLASAPAPAPQPTIPAGYVPAPPRAELTPSREVQAEGAKRIGLGGAMLILGAAGLAAGPLTLDIAVLTVGMILGVPLALAGFGLVVRGARMRRGRTPRGDRWRMAFGGILGIGSLGLFGAGFGLLGHGLGIALVSAAPVAFAVGIGLLVRGVRRRRARASGRTEVVLGPGSLRVRW